MLNAIDLTEQLLHRRCNETLNLRRARTGERHGNICHRDIDLRFFFSWRHQHGKDTEQHCRESQQRRQLAREEKACDSAAGSERRRRHAQF